MICDLPCLNLNLDTKLQLVLLSVAAEHRWGSHIVQCIYGVQLVALTPRAYPTHLAECQLLQILKITPKYESKNEIKFEYLAQNLLQGHHYSQIQTPESVCNQVMVVVWIHKRR